MKVFYQKRFLRQLAQVPPDMRAKIERFAFEDLPNAATIKAIGKIEKMSGYKEFYKIRFGSYRVGMKIESDNVTLQVVMDRKDIYKIFP